MAFTRTWNAAYEASPADGADALEGAARIREIKTDVKERLVVDHVMDETANDGKHKQVTLPDRTSDPSSVAATGFVYTKDVSGVVELFYEDSSGNVIQLTDNGALKEAAAFPSATAMLFRQAAAPTGWTKDTTAALNNTALRLVTGTPADYVGSSFTSVFASGRATTSAGSHSHNTTIPKDGWSATAASNARAFYPTGSANRVNDRTLTSTSSGSHSHTADFNVSYTDVIIATKD